MNTEIQCSLADLPEDIRMFYAEEVRSEATGNQIEESFTYIDENGNTVTDTRWVDEYVDVTYVVLVPRPETKSLADVEQVIKHNPANESAINQFIELYGLGLQWDWFEAHQQWLRRKEAFDAYLEGLPTPLPDEEAVEPPVFNEVEPVRPPLLSVAEYRATLVIDGLTIDEYLFRFNRAINVKRIIVEVDGLSFDGDEDSQRRMLSALAAAEVTGLSTTVWRLADNSMVEVTRDQLARAHALSILEQGKLWMPPAK